MEDREATPPKSLVSSRFLAVTFFALGALSAQTAFAQDKEPAPVAIAPHADAPPLTIVPPPPPRPRSDEPFDYGRPATGTGAGDVLIWIPRVLFFPLYLVTEYVIRAPLRSFTSFVEAKQVIPKLKDFFVFGPDNNIGIVPTGLFDFRFRPSVGIYFFWDDFLAKNNALRAHVATGGEDWFLGAVTDRIGIDKDSFVKLRFQGEIRPDYAFFGLGSRSLDTNRSRYQATDFEGTVGFDATPRPGITFEAYTSVHSYRFNAQGNCCGDPPLADLVTEGRLTLPQGFSGYTALRQGLWVKLDSREPRPAPGSGVRVEANAEHDFDLQNPGQSAWIRWGGAVGGFLDLTGKNRVLSLSLATEFADPLSNIPVPFTELAALGGDNPMVGFFAGRLLDRSSIAATLEYRWPIWSFLDGTLQYAVGNVFGEHLEDFEADLLRMSFAGGVRSSGSRDHSFNVLFGSGTETFKDGSTLNSLRFVFGATTGF